MNQICKEIGSYGLVPVIKIDDPEKAVPLAKALCDGGLPVAEITFRTACAAEAIARITKEFPDMLVGAGTVLTTEQVDRAVAAGSKFIVSPGFNPKVVAYCVEKGIPIVPGTSRPSDVEAAIELGLDTVKFFPAEAAGGVAMLSSMGGPYANITFMPTGGIDEKNLMDYLTLKNVLACGGSFMVKNKYIDEGRFDLITADVKTAMTAMLGFKLAHIGIIDESDVLDTVRVKVKKAYPSYFGAYNEFDCVRDFLDTVDNLYCLGRNGQHRYNNMDHSMGTAFKAVEAIKNGSGDRTAIWEVNTEQSYHEKK